MQQHTDTASVKLLSFVMESHLQSVQAFAPMAEEAHPEGGIWFQAQCIFQEDSISIHIPHFIWCFFFPCVNDAL